MKHILVLNCGSSSIKFKIVALPAATTLLAGAVTGIAQKSGKHQLTRYSGDKPENCEETAEFKDHAAAFETVQRDLTAALQQADLTLDAIGHRVVHGGTAFIEPVQLTPALVEQIAELEYLAPQHLPANLQGIRLCMALFDELPQVAVFDTAFHHNMPDYAYRYPVPEQWFSEFGIRRYGFHGSSHQYIADKAAEMLGKPLDQLNFITLHLGNGDSACAIRQGKSMDTSMGFTPLEGLMMGSRSGDLDASIPLYLQQRHGMSADEIARQLNFDSGLQAICGSHDMREIIERVELDDAKARLALEMFVYHVRKYIGAYLVALGRVDALVFTGGIGENASLIRALCCDGLEPFGLALDKQKNIDNRNPSADISSIDSAIRVLVIATDEELQIAREVFSLLDLKTELV
jgi:acetate kinase